MHAQTRTRMSPLTALFLGIFGVGGVAIASATLLAFRGMEIVDSKASSIISFAEGTIEGLPDLINSLPPTIGDLLDDRRAPDYATFLDVEVRLVADEKSGGVRPVLTVNNTGSKVVSLLSVRVAALDDQGVPVHDWTEVVATPIALDDDWERGWRGPLLPGNVRYVVLSRSRSMPPGGVDSLTGVIEVSDVRVWRSASEL